MVSARYCLGLGWGQQSTRTVMPSSSAVSDAGPPGSNVRTMTTLLAPSSTPTKPGETIAGAVVGPGRGPAAVAHVPVEGDVVAPEEVVRHAQRATPVDDRDARGAAVDVRPAGLDGVGEVDGGDRAVLDVDAGDGVVDDLDAGDRVVGDVLGHLTRRAGHPQRPRTDEHDEGRGPRQLRRPSQQLPATRCPCRQYSRDRRWRDRAQRPPERVPRRPSQKPGSGLDQIRLMRSRPAPRSRPSPTGRPGSRPSCRSALGACRGRQPSCARC